MVLMYCHTRITMYVLLIVVSFLRGSVPTHSLRRERVPDTRGGPCPYTVESRSGAPILPFVAPTETSPSRGTGLIPVVGNID